ncbi:hypothetical protein [Nocardia nepalensis]|uniref:hypothetical protein n=1 Tax=Nocardia nepalensis TaxID=3375448 RepID=UPI003B685E90
MRCYAAVVVLVGALGACASEPAANHAATSVPRTAQPISTTVMSSSPPPAVPTSVRLPAEGDIRRSLDTVSVNCTGERESKVRKASVFDAGAGRFVDVPAPPVSARAELIDYFCAIIGHGQQVRAVYVVSTRTPAEGLKPETSETSVVSFALGASTPATRAAFPGGRSASQSVDRLFPTNAGLLVTGTRLSMVLDPETLLPKWQADFRPEYVTDDAVAHSIDDGVRFVSVETGQEIGRFDNGVLVRESSGHVMENVPQGLRGGFVVQRTAYPDNSAWYFDTRTNQLIGPLAQDGSAVRATVADGNRLMVYGGGIPAQLLRIHDLSSHTVPVDKVGVAAQGLNIENAYMAGSYLYLVTREYGRSVVDVESNEKVADSWSLLPMDRVGDWRLVIDGPKITNGYAKCFDYLMDYLCYERGRLVRTVNGNYPGPWY